MSYEEVGMKVYRDLIITGSPDSIDEVLQRMRSTRNDEWSTQQDTSLIQWCPGRSTSDTRFRLVIYRRAASEGLEALSVVNIVPLEIGARLSTDQYNSILDRFLHEIVTPSIEGLEVGVRSDKEDVAPSDFMSEECFALLESFAGAANKSIPHPLDKRRWRLFEIATYRAGFRDIPSNILGGWLAEQGWSEEGARDLAIEFSQAMDLLTDWEEHFRAE